MQKNLLFPTVALSIALLAFGCARQRPEPPLASATAVTAAPAKPSSALPQTSRKVIRSAELSIEVNSPAAAESDVSRLIERLGGYLASSERELVADEGQRSQARVALSLRVPAERLDEALRELKRLGKGAETEKLGSEDVTDEYIDVDARITNQRHLEQQLAQLLTQANNVESALKVHQELTAVRTEIDRLEGRKRFLETESALAKISLSLTPLRPVVVASSTEFGVSLRRATADSLMVGAAVITFSIRAAGVLTPIGLLLGLPAWGLSYWLRKRRRKLAVAVGL